MSYFANLNQRAKSTKAIHITAVISQVVLVLILALVADANIL